MKAGIYFHLTITKKNDTIFCVYNIKLCFVKLQYIMKTLSLLLLFSLIAYAKKNEYGVPIPKPVKTKINVGTYIFPGWYRGKKVYTNTSVKIENRSEWRLIAKFPGPRPLLGFYDDSIPEVNDWHIKWAVEAGISWFAFDWYWNREEKHLHRSLEEGFLNAKYKNMMKFCVNWCNHPLDWKKPLDFSPEALTEMMDYCIKNYFLLPNYLKINNRPVFMVWNMQAVIDANGGAENFRENVLPKVNAVCNKAGLGDLFLIVVTQKPYHFDEKGITDAHASYSFASAMTDSRYEVPGSAPYSEMVDRLPEEWEIMKQLKIPYIVTTQAGWDDTPRTLGHGNNTPWVRTDNNVKLFERTLREGKVNVVSNFPFFIIEAWNEWGEGSFIEPGKKFQFTQLDAIRNVFALSAGHNKWVKPTKKQVLKYSVLKGKELVAAHAKEKETPPPVPKRHTWSTDVVNDPKKQTGKVIDTIHFNDSSIKKYNMRNNSLEILSFKNNRLSCKIIGKDPKILISGQWGKFADIAGVKLKVVYKGTAQNSAQLFWETSDSPLNEKKSRIYPWFYDEKPHTYFIKFKKNYARTGNLKAIRVDFPASRGSVAEIEWVKIIRY